MPSTERAEHPAQVSGGQRKHEINALNKDCVIIFHSSHVTAEQLAEHVHT